MISKGKNFDIFKSLNFEPQEAREWISANKFRVRQKGFSLSEYLDITLTVKLSADACYAGLACYWQLF